MFETYIMLYITSDHAGFELKERLKNLLSEQGLEFADLNPVFDSEDDYPDKAVELAEKLKHCHSEQSEESFDSNQNDGIAASQTPRNDSCFGVAICGTGQGICMAMNRFAWVRAGLVDNVNDAEKIREHNHANVLCLPGPYSDKEFTDQELIDIVNSFVQTEEDTSEKHARRVKKLSDLG